MKRNAYADTTIRAVGKRLRHLKKHCDMHDLESVKTFIGNKTASNAYKETLIEAGFEYVTDQDGLKLYRKRK